MKEENYEIFISAVKEKGKIQFYWSRYENLKRAGDVLPAIVDYDKGGEIYRVEVLYIQSELRENNLILKDIKRYDNNSKSEYVIQIGGYVPVSLIIRVDSMYERPSFSCNAEGYLLSDGCGACCGIEFRVDENVRYP